MSSVAPSTPEVVVLIGHKLSTHPVTAVVGPMSNADLAARLGLLGDLWLVVRVLMILALLFPFVWLPSGNAVCHVSSDTFRASFVALDRRQAAMIIALRRIISGKGRVIIKLTVVA